MSDIADQLVRLGEGIAFPGRLRLFAEERVAGALPPGCAREWPQSGPAALLAAACGAAWAEAPRGGRVAVVVAAAPERDPGWAAAHALVGRLGLVNLRIIVAEGAAAAADAGDALRREWQPVRLASLPMGGFPPWLVDADGQAMEAWLAEHEPRALLAHRVDGWAGTPPEPALLIALGQLAAEGRRVVWRVPAGAPLADWREALITLGRRGLGLKLIVGEPPSAELLTTPTGWWVWSPADAGELAATFANVLDHEEPALVVLPGPAVGITPWPATRAGVAGEGRLLAEGGAVTVVADGRRAGRALALAQAVGGAGAFACTCLAPLPLPQLAALAARGLLVVLDEGLAAAIAPVAGGRVLALPATGDLAGQAHHVRAMG